MIHDVYIIDLLQFNSSDRAPVSRVIIAIIYSPIFDSADSLVSISGTMSISEVSATF